MHSLPLLAALGLLACLASGCGVEAPEDEVLVLAAASLASVGPELGEAYRARSGTPVRFSFGSSAALARQVAAGAPADWLLSADRAVHPLIVDLMPQEDAFLVFARNELVLVTQAEAAWPPEGLRAVTRVAVGDWRAGVPVGLRARQWLSEDGTWAMIEESLVPCVDARATLSAVASGSVQAGIVYATDAASSASVRIVERAGPKGPTVDYFAFELGELRDSEHSFGRFLGGAEAGSVLLEHGFVLEGIPGRSAPR